MTSTSFGERLRREREMRGVSLEEISIATRINARFLEALENEQWENLPGGVFTRGFIRTVARFLGLDEESIIAEYSLASNDKPEVAVWADKPQPPRRRGLALGVALVLLFAAVAGVSIAYRRYAPGLAAILHERIGRPAAQNAAANPNPPTANEAESSGQGTGAAAAAASTEGSSPPSTTAVVPALQPSGDALVLAVAAGRSTNLTVSADGRILFSGVFPAGGSQKYQAQERFEIAAADPSAILLELNGQTMPPLGQPGQAAHATLTRKDLENLSGGHH